MAFQLPDLPYGRNALEPHVSSDTLDYHYGKHHKAYVDKLNGAIEGTNYADLELVEIIRRSHANGDTNVFNNAAQAWNHEFLWNSMSPDGGGKPEGRLAELIDAAFGGLDGFRDAFRQAATGQFGSGWAWLVLDKGRLVIETTGNAETPMAHGRACLLTLDVWEHAYYLDYQNRRPDYLKAAIGKLNWKRASELFEQAS